MNHMTAMKAAMINAIPKSTQFKKFNGNSEPTTVINSKQLVIPIRFTEGTDDHPPKMVKAKPITRAIRRFNEDGSVVDEFGEVWQAADKGDGRHMWAVC